MLEPAPPLPCRSFTSRFTTRRRTASTSQRCAKPLCVVWEVQETGGVGRVGKEAALEPAWPSQQAVASRQRTHAWDLPLQGNCPITTLPDHMCLQVPDIYDSAKYDAIHNAHLGLDMRVSEGCMRRTWGGMGARPSIEHGRHPFPPTPSPQPSCQTPRLALLPCRSCTACPSSWLTQSSPTSTAWTPRRSCASAPRSRQRCEGGGVGLPEVLGPARTTQALCACSL